MSQVVPMRSGSNVCLLYTSLGLFRIQVAHERDQLAHVGLFLVADVRQDGLRNRVVGGQVVRFVQVDGLKLAGDVQAKGLHEFLVRHLAIDVAGKRVGKTGHDVPLFQRAAPTGRRIRRAGGSGVGAAFSLRLCAV